jgi:hypothetical protein
MVASAYADIRYVIESQTNLRDNQRIFGKFEHGLSADRTLKSDYRGNSEIESWKPSAHRRVRRHRSMTVLYKKTLDGTPRFDIVAAKFSDVLADKVVSRTRRIGALGLLGVECPEPFSARAFFSFESEIAE